MNMNCFVYKWTHLPTLMWYVGSHTSKKAHPDNGYICSSKKVKAMILDKPDEWLRTIVAIGSAEDMFELETEILQLFDAKRDVRSFNQHNNNKSFNRAGLTAPNKGMPMSEESKAKMIESKTGKSTAKKGKKYPGSRPQHAIDAVKAKVTGMTMAHKGKPWSQARRDAQMSKYSFRSKA